VLKTQSKDEITTIQITKETRDELKKLGIKGETYDEIIKRLVELAKKK
jgi:hypothetical protein